MPIWHYRGEEGNRDVRLGCSGHLRAEIYVTGLDIAVPLSQVTFQNVTLQIKPKNG